MDTQSQSPLVWLYNQTKGHHQKYVLSVLIAVTGVAFSVAPYFVIISVVKGLLSGVDNTGFYVSRCIVIALLWLGRVVCHSLSTSLSHVATFTVLGEIRKKGTDKLTRMPLGAVLSQSTGALKNILIERIDAIETTLAHIIPEFTANLLIPVIIIIGIFVIDWRMGFAAIAAMPLGMTCYIGMMTGSQAFYQRTVDATKALNNTAIEYINGIQVIKVFGKTKSSYERFVRDANEGANSYIDWMRASILPFTFAMSIMPATMLTVLPIGGLLVRSGSLSSLDFMTIIILSVGVLTPIITCMSYSDDLRTLSTTINEVRSIIDGQEMVRPSSDIAITSHTLTLNHVTFAYQDKEVLHDISLEVPEGQFVALVGPSGSGKSTIARLIASLWDVKSGVIRLGDIDIKDIPFEQYMDQIAFVSQDNFLFNMSVMENIRIGRVDASDEDVIEAAKKSGCHEFIMNLEHGYETVVGSSGGHLSGGERQRIAIARAMLKAAPIVILDEATAYTDSENEAVIQRSVSELTIGKTLIVIAHRLSTITDADCIYVVKDGYINDAGTHEELLSHHGLYEAMWQQHIAVKDEM